MKKIRIWFLRHKLSTMEYRLKHLWELEPDLKGEAFSKEWKDIQRQIEETKTSLEKLTLA